MNVIPELACILDGIEGFSFGYCLALTMMKRVSLQPTPSRCTPTV